MRLVMSDLDTPLSTKQTENDLQFYVYCAQMGLEKEDQLAAVCLFHCASCLSTVCASAFLSITTMNAGYTSLPHQIEISR